MERTKIFKLLKSDNPMDQVLIKGWVRTRRDSKGFSFIEINDGSSLKNIQVVADEKLPNYEDIKKSTWRPKTFHYRRSVTPMNFYEPLPI